MIPLFLRDESCAECAELPARGVSVVPGGDIDVVGAIGPDRWAGAWGVWSADRAAEAKIQRELAETLHQAGRLSTPARDAIVADAGKFDDMAVGS